jgi:hypothetical protein
MTKQLSRLGWLPAAWLAAACAASPATTPPAPTPTPTDTVATLPTPGVPVGVPLEGDEPEETPRPPRPEAPRPEPIPEAPPVRERPAERPPAAPTAGPVTSPLPVPDVAVLPGAVLPRQRIVAYYGNPASTRMGILGELPPDEMLARLDAEVEAWRRADPFTPVRPALHLITVMAAGDPGPDGMYRIRQPASRITQVMEWAERRGALVFLDIQPGRSSVREELPRLERWLTQPHVHLALDPEWAMGPNEVPGRRIGSMSAADVNYAMDFLAALVEEHRLPPKVLVVHRFTQGMLRNARDIRTDPRVQVVIHMDGWGPPAQKVRSYRDFVVPEADQFTGFKLFYHNDRRSGSRMMTPEEILQLRPVPFYIQYQ